MRIILTPDSFKGSMTAMTVAGILKEEAGYVFPGCECVEMPMADGGEGTLKILLSVMGGSEKELRVKGPLFEDIRAGYGLLPGGSAAVEMAVASGLPLVPPERRNPLKTTTHGTGQLIRQALEDGCRKIIVGVGGSATNDGGTGALSALGVKFLNGAGEPLPGIGESLEAIRSIDLSGLHPAVRETEFIVMCDIDNPLTGPRGATYVYGPQKGGTPERLEILERGMVHYARLVKESLSVDLSAVSGAGAAGGLAGGLHAFLDAKLRSGIKTLLDLYKFDEAVGAADLVVTGEGQVDGQSAYGKVLHGVGAACRKANVPVIAVAGGISAGAEAVYNCGIDSVMSIVNAPMRLDDAMENGRALLRDAARRMFLMVKTGMKINSQGGNR